MGVRVGSAISLLAFLGKEGDSLHGLEVVLLERRRQGNVDVIVEGSNEKNRYT